MQMKILIVGGGGREHALAWKAAQSPRVKRVYVAPGNAGTAGEPGVENVSIGAENILKLKDFAKKNGIDLTLIGPEAPLVAGIVDAFQDAGLNCFGPSKAAAKLEGSKVFAKDFLKKYRIPTAAYAVFTEAEPAFRYLDTQKLPIVVKADGLAAGKGVIIAHTAQEARAAVRAMLNEGKFGAAGRRVVIEEYLQGEELSFIVIADGEQVLPLADSQDHKARDAGDTGPNTGGMGGYSPVPLLDASLRARIMADIIRPTVRGMRAEGRDYSGFLYAGLMIGADGAPKVLEFNCRLGDPETQAILPRLQSDLVELCLAASEGRLDEQPKPDWDPRAALGVVTAAAGYPAEVRKGDIIGGLEGVPKNIKIFHGGTKDEHIVTAGGRDLCDTVIPTTADGRDPCDTVTSKRNILTAGGRVLCVTGLGTSVGQAREQVYAALSAIHYEDMFYRKDIGHRALNKRG